MRAAMTIAACVILLSGCGGGSADIAAMSARIDRLEQEIRLVKVDATMAKAEASLAAAQRERFSDSVSFDVRQGTHYLIVSTSMGLIPLSLLRIEPYLDGQRGILQVGNLSAATYERLKLVVRWTDKAGGKKESSVDVLQTVPPGYWVNVPVTLPKTKVDDLSYLTVSVDTSQAALGMRTVSR